MRRIVAIAIAFAFALTLATTARADPSTDFHKLLDDHWAWTLASNPELATTLGVRSYDDKLTDLSLAHIDRSAAEAATFLARAEAIPVGALTAADKLNRDILERLLRREVAADIFGQRQMLFGNRSGWHTNAAEWPNQFPFYTLADYRSYVARLHAYPAQNAQGIATTRGALAGGFTLPCDAMGGFERTISGVIAATPQTSVFWAPFARPRPGTIGEADWTALQTDAASAIQTGVMPAFRDFLAFYRADYAPRCARAPGVSAQPNGQAWYAHLAREETTTDLTPDQIHTLGLSEVARIRAEMDAVVARSGFAGDRHAFIAHLRTDPALYPKTAAELIAASSVLTKRIDGEMPRLFGHLPRLPYTVKAIPDATADGNTTAYYQPGSPESGKAGTYYVNLTHLDQRPFYEQPALTLHEAVPGHHNQIALQQELDIPPFRRDAEFTAFTEGWGLYSERLGIEMGLYDTPEKDMGRLSYEMWRACRLVVDTGIHAQGWTKAQAIAFMTENTALTAANIEAEVNRYIAGPGQALAYKLGELRIRALRAEAERRLGPKFDIRGFHDAVLANGSVPLDVLDTQVKAWIAAREQAG